LVTGGTGFLGKRLVPELIRNGFTVRVLARKLSRIELLLNAGVEIFFGDVADAVSMGLAFEDVDYVVHAAAHTGGNGEEGRLTTVKGTQNVLDLCEQKKIRKLVYISSCSVYGVFDYHEGQLIAEDASLERYPEKRGSYSQAKVEAENLVTQAMERNEVPIVCLRPGTIFGPGGQIFTPMMGFSLDSKIFFVIHNGDFILPLVYVDNLASAIVAALRNERSTGRIYNVVDPERVTKKTYMQRLVKKVFPKAKTIYFPYSFLNFAVYFQEKLFHVMKRPPFLTRYRLISSQKPILYDGSKIMDELAWNPSVSMSQAFEAIIRNESENM
jgi:nucleoside-diphosphate-sugar epimerase